ncbi:MAG: hypothetical protein ACFFCD_06435 [Promethearchaeota archaeon]
MEKETSRQDEAWNGKANEIREKMRYTELLTRIVSCFEDYLKEIIEKEMNERPRFISINDVTSIRKMGRTGKINLVSVNLGTDVGSFKTMLALKFSSTPKKTIQEAENSKLLSERLEKLPAGFNNLKTPKLVYNDPKSNLLVYEGIFGKTYVESSIDRLFKAKNAGKLLAAIHGSQTDRIDVDKYKGLMALILLDLPLTDHHKRDISLAVDFHLSKMRHSLGGSLIFADFHMDNIIFGSSIKRDDLEYTVLNDMSALYKQNVYVIDPEFLCPGDSCRFEDIGTFFAFPALREFRQFGTIDETRKDILTFLMGYNKMMARIGTNNLADLYPHGFPIGFHMAYNLFLGARELIRLGVAKGDENVLPEVENRIILGIQLLQNNII